MTKAKNPNTPEIQTKDGKNPANSYTPTYSSYVAEVNKIKNLFTRWHTEI